MVRTQVYVHVTICVYDRGGVCVLYDLKNSIVPPRCLSNYENIQYFQFS